MMVPVSSVCGTHNSLSLLFGVTSHCGGVIEILAVVRTVQISPIHSSSAGGLANLICIHVYERVQGTTMFTFLF